MSALYARYSTFEEVAACAESIMRTRRVHLNVLVAAYKDSLIRTLARDDILRKPRYEVSLLWEHGDLAAFELTHKRKVQGHARSTTDRFIVYQHDHIALVISFCASDFFSGGVQGLLDCHGVDCFRSYMTTPRLLAILERIAAFDFSEGFTVGTTVFRSKYEGMGASADARPSSYETDVRYLRHRSLDELKEMIELEKVWVTSVAIRFQLPMDRPIGGVGQREISFTLKRNLSAKLNGGFRVFCELVLPTWRDVIAQHHKLFSGRDRRPQDEYAAHPLMISFPYPVFQETRQIGRLVECLRTYPRASVSFLARDAHLHAGVTDFCDGSSFDVWCLSLGRILVVPQLRATVGSLERLCGYLCEEFHEGDVAEFKEQPDDD